jgi:hypothetical protein
MSPHLLSFFGTTSTASPFLYMNQANYDPEAVSGLNLTGGWNLETISGNGIGLDSAALLRARLSSMHVQFQLTGVNNYDKKGTIHLAETIQDTHYYGHVTDSINNELFCYQAAIPKLPKFNKYKSIEIVNMDSESALEYHYVPTTNEFLLGQLNDVGFMSGTGGLAAIGKQFALIVKGAAVGTTIRARYELTFEAEVATEHVGTYIPYFSRCFVSSEPTLQLISQNPDYAIRINQKQGHIDKSLYDDLALSSIANASKKPSFLGAKVSVM